MALPFTPTPYHAALYAALEPLAYDDAALGYPLFQYTAAIASMEDQVDTYASDTDDGRPGWSNLLDVDRCPSEALPWLAQFLGVKIDTSLADADQRNQIRNVDGFKRGTLGSIIGAAQKHLTGSQTVYYKERDSAVDATAEGAYGLTVLTLTTETPDPTAVENAILAVKPAGIILSYATVSGMTYQLLNTNYASYSAVNSSFATYNGVYLNQPGT